MNIDKVVETYVILRDRRAARKAAFEKEDEKDKNNMGKLEEMLLTFFNSTGQESARSIHGTAYKKVTTSTSVADKEIFMEFALEHPEFLEARCNKTAAEAYMEQHGEVPPGVNVSRKLTIGVQRGKGD